MSATRRLPTRGEFSSRQRRFVDGQGRVYVLPKRDDPVFQRFVALGTVDGDNYERKLRKGLDFDAEKELRQLTSTALFYVELPREQKYDSWSSMPRNLDPLSAVDAYGGDRMPALSGSANDTGKQLVLREVESGALYTGRVDIVEAKRRSKRGFVVVSHVRRINREQVAQKLPQQ